MFIGTSEKSRALRERSQTGPSDQSNPSAIRSTRASCGTSLSNRGSSRSIVPSVGSAAFSCAWACPAKTKPRAGRQRRDRRASAQPERVPIRAHDVKVLEVGCDRRRRPIHSAAHLTERIGRPGSRATLSPPRSSRPGEAVARVRRSWCSTCLAFPLPSSSKQATSLRADSSQVNSAERSMRQPGQMFAVRGLVQDHSDRAGDRTDVGRIEVDARVADDLRQRARPARDDRRAAGHRLDGRQAEAFQERRQNQGISTSCTDKTRSSSGTNPVRITRSSKSVPRDGRADLGARECGRRR